MSKCQLLSGLPMHTQPPAASNTISTTPSPTINTIVQNTFGYTVSMIAQNAILRKHEICIGIICGIFLSLTARSGLFRSSNETTMFS